MTARAKGDQVISNILAEKEFIPGRPVMNLGSDVITDDTSRSVVDQGLGSFRLPVFGLQVKPIMRQALLNAVEGPFEKAEDDGAVEALGKCVFCVLAQEAAALFFMRVTTAFVARRLSRSEPISSSRDARENLNRLTSTSISGFPV